MTFYKRYRYYINISLIIIMVVGNYIVAQNTWLQNRTPRFTPSPVLIDFDIDSTIVTTLPDIPKTFSTDVLTHPLFVSLTPIESFTIPTTRRANLTDESLFQFDRVQILESNDGSYATIVWTLPPFTPFEKVAVYRSEKAGERGFKVGEVDINVRTWRDSTIGGSTNLYYALRPIRSDGTEFESLHQYPAHIVDAKAPPPPTELAVERVSEKAVVISWKNPDVNDRAFSRIYRGTVPGSGVSLIADGVDTDTYTDISVVPGEQYIYVVTSVDTSYNESEYRIPSNLVAPLGAASLAEPYPFTDIAIDEALSDGGVRISWNTPIGEGFDHARIYRSNTLGDIGERIGDAAADAASYIDVSGTIGDVYYYALRAVDVSGNESITIKQHPGVLRDTIPPAPPRNVTVTVNNKEEAIVTWSPPQGDVSHYRVYRSSIPGERGYLITDNINETSMSDAIRSNVEYFYTVTAVDRTGNESTLAFPTGSSIPFEPQSEF